MYPTRRRPSFRRLRKVRFFKPVTSYLVNVHTKFLIVNLYYKTSLEQFQSLKEKDKEYHEFAWELNEQQTLAKLFFI